MEYFSFRNMFITKTFTRCVQFVSSFNYNLAYVALVLLYQIHDNYLALIN